MSSPTKGKTPDAARSARTSWWDLHPLVEDVRRPVVWSTSSTIFTAHPTQPAIVARLFPSSKQFVVVSPEPVLCSPASFAPPTVIAVSPSDHWLFAFFPSPDRGGIACLWSHGPSLDAWTVKEHWSLARGSGVIACAWAGTDREWATSADGSSFRLPPCGPLTPVSNPTLLLVTQAHQLHVCYFHAHSLSFKMLQCSLTQPYFAVEDQPFGAIHDTPAGPQTSRLCIYATVGFIYGGTNLFIHSLVDPHPTVALESSVLVAMRSRRYPTTDSLKPAAYDDLDLDISLDIPQSQDSSQEEHGPSLEWGALAEEQTIELCEVKLRFDGTHMNLTSQPLPPLHSSFSHLGGLTFICSPPLKSDPSTSPRTSPKKDNLKQPIRLAEPTPTFLVASFLDFEEYSTIPRSAVVAYTLVRAPSSASPAKTTWTIHQVGERLFFPRVSILPCPAWIPTNPRRRGLITLLSDAGGPISRRRQKEMEIVIGDVVALRLPDLADDPEWEQLPIVAPIGRAGMNCPVNMTMSRNQVLLCTVTLCTRSVHTLPKQFTKSSTLGDSAARNISPLSTVLVTSLHSRVSIADIAHVLTVPTVPLDTIVDTLRGTWLAFEINVRAGIIGTFNFADVLGATVELYRTRSRAPADDEEKELLSSLWRNAHDMCSIIACHAAFEDCKEPEGYDLGAIWQLVCLSEWLVSFLEKLVRECLFAADLTDLTPNANEFQPKPEPDDGTDVLALDDSKRPLSSPLNSPVLLHLTHPFILTNLIGVIAHVNRFYHSLGALAPKGENSRIARDILMDVIGCSGLDLRGIEEILKAAVPETRGIPGDETRLSLSKCHPVPAQYPFLRKVVHTLCTSTAINRPRLFIKIADLVDAFANVSTVEQSGKEQDRDVITKCVLTRHNPGLLCLRCGYKSGIGGGVSMAGRISLRWRTWEKLWANRCICGGAWIRGNL